MAASWTLLTLGLGAAILALMLVAPRRMGAQAWPAWDLVLSSQLDGRRRYEEYEADLADELTGLMATLRLARRETQHGDWTNADRTLAAAARYVSRHVPTLRQRLATWRDASRALSAVYPLPRLEVLAFQAWRLRGAAAGEGLARLALDATHRYALRVSVLLYGLNVVLRGFGRRAPVGQARSDEALLRRLRELDELGTDLGTLHGASLAAYRALLISIHHDNARPPESGT